MIRKAKLHLVFISTMMIASDLLSFFPCNTMGWKQLQLSWVENSSFSLDPVQIVIKVVYHSSCLIHLSYNIMSFSFSSKLGSLCYRCYVCGRQPLRWPLMVQPRSFHASCHPLPLDLSWTYWLPVNRIQQKYSDITFEIEL